jgi:hypothetical protein
MVRIPLASEGVGSYKYFRRIHLPGGKIAGRILIVLFERATAAGSDLDCDQQNPKHDMFHIGVLLPKILGPCTLIRRPTQTSKGASSRVREQYDFIF